MLPPLIPLHLTLAQIDQIVSKSQFLPTNPILLSEKENKKKAHLDLPPFPSPDGDAYLSCVEVIERVLHSFRMLVLNKMTIQRSLYKMTPVRRHHNYVRSEKSKKKKKTLFIVGSSVSNPHWNSMISAIHRLERMVITSHTTHNYITPHKTTSHHTTPHHTI